MNRLTTRLLVSLTLANGFLFVLNLILIWCSSRGILFKEHNTGQPLVDFNQISCKKLTIKDDESSPSAYLQASNNTVNLVFHDRAKLPVARFGINKGGSIMIGIGRFHIHTDKGDTELTLVDSHANYRVVVNLEEKLAVRIDG